MAQPPPTPPAAAPDIPPPVPANIPSATGAPPLAPDAPVQENPPPLRAAETPPVHSPESGSSQSVGTGRRRGDHECRFSFYAEQTEQADVDSA